MKMDMINKRLAEPVLLVLLTAAYYKLPWGELPGPVEVWGIPFLLAYVFVLPGNMLRKTISPQEQNPVVRSILVLLYGLFFFLFVCFLWALTRANLAWLRLNFPGWIFLLYIATSMRKKDVGWIAKTRVSFRKSAVLLLVLGVPAAVFVWKAGLPIGWTKDTLDHIAYVNEIQETGEAFPENSFYADAGENGKDIRKGLLHVFYGFTGDYLSIDGMSSLRIWNAVFILILIGAMYGSAFILFGNQWVALLSSVLFIIGAVGGLGAATLREAFYANRFGYAYLLFVIALSIRYMKTGKKLDLLGCGCFAFAASAVHIFFTVLSCFAMAIIVIWKTCISTSSFRKHLRNGILLSAAVAAGIVPYGLFRYLTSYGPSNELHKEAQGVVFMGNSLFIASPLKIFSWFGMLGFVSFIIALAMWRRRREHVGLGYLIAAGFTIPLLVFNPFILPLLYKVLGYLVFRLPMLFPFFILAAFYLADFFGAMGGERRRTTLSWLLFAGLLLAAVVDFLPVFQKSPVTPASLRAEKRNSYLRWNDGLTYIRNNVPEGSIIVSDPMTSYSISAFTKDYITCMYDQHAPPGDLLLQERLSMTRDVLTPFLPVSTAISLMEAMGADYIVLNNRSSELGLFQYWAMQPSIYFAAREKFMSHRDLFRPRFQRNGFLVLEWTGKKPEKVAIAANPYFLQEIPRDFTVIGREAGLANLEAYYLEDEYAEMGTDLEISLLWSGSREYGMDNYVVEIRFDHVDIDLPFGGKPFPKLARKVMEIVRNKRYRFRASHKILGGFLSPDVWPGDTFVLDPNTISIPSDIARGRYTVSVKLIASAAMANYHVRDFLFDNDIYQGIPIDTVSIN